VSGGELGRLLRTGEIAPVTICRRTPAASARSITASRSRVKLSCVRFEPMSINAIVMPPL